MNFTPDCGLLLVHFVRLGFPSMSICWLSDVNIPYNIVWSRQPAQPKCLPKCERAWARARLMLSKARQAHSYAELPLLLYVTACSFKENAATSLNCIHTQITKYQACLNIYELCSDVVIRKVNGLSFLRKEMIPLWLHSLQFPWIQ